LARTQNRLAIEVEEGGIGFNLTEGNDRARGLQGVQRRAMPGVEVIVERVPDICILIGFPVDDIL
jgi:hypothetical protein